MTGAEAYFVVIQSAARDLQFLTIQRKTADSSSLSSSERQNPIRSPEPISINPPAAKPSYGATVVLKKIGSMFEKGRPKGTPFPGNTP